MRDFRSKVIKGFAWEGATKLIIQAMSWASTIIVARLLSPEDYGIVAISGVFIVLLTVVAGMGFSAGLINKKRISNNEITGIFWLGLLIAFILTVAMILAAPFIEVMFDMPGLANIIIVSSTVFVFVNLKCVPTAIVLREMNFKYRSLVDMAAQFASILTVITMAYLGYGAWSLVFGTLAGHIISTLAYIPYMRNIGFFAINWLEIKYVVSFGAKVMLSRLIDSFTLLLPTFLVGLVLNQKTVGQYSMAEQLGKIPLNKIGVIFNRVLFPAISRIKDDIDYSRLLFFKFHRVLLMISFPVLTGIAIISPDLVVFLFTEKWAPIVPIIQFICTLNLIQVSSMIMPSILNGAGKPGIVFRYRLLFLVLIPVASIIGLQWGVMGMLISWCFVYPVTYGYILIQLSLHLKFTLLEFFKTFFSVIVATIIMVTVLLVEKEFMVDFNMFNRLIFLVLSGALTFGCIYYFYFFKEVKEIYSLIKKEIIS